MLSITHVIAVRNEVIFDKQRHEYTTLFPITTYSCHAGEIRIEMQNLKIYKPIAARK